ncbi:MAG TPA: hypothetical protein VHD57_02055 [Vicinamibacterales bacterium]|nr:hypothetical protein [Vicinamibacterales bacterium]
MTWRMCASALVASCGFGLLAAGCGDTQTRPVIDPVTGVPHEQQRAISSRDFGVRWPFTAETATLACVDDAVVARVNGVNYAVNAAATGRGFAPIAPTVRMQPSLPPTNPYPGLRQGDRERVFAESMQCEQWTDGRDAAGCKAGVRAAHGLSDGALAQIEAEGHERIWPPLPPRKQSLAPILDAGLQLCPRPSPQRR